MEKKLRSLFNNQKSSSNLNRDSLFGDAEEHCAAVDDDALEQVSGAGEKTTRIIPVLLNPEKPSDR